MNIPVSLHARSSVHNAQLTYRECEEDRCEVSVSFGSEQYIGLADDFFEALLSVRAQLESKGLLIAVRGATRDVWPSAMSRQMAGGLKAYRMVIGRQALSQDLVDIFGVAEDVVPATVRDQIAYRDAWFKSLGNGAET